MNKRATLFALSILFPLIVSYAQRRSRANGSGSLSRQRRLLSR